MTVTKQKSASVSHPGKMGDSVNKTTKEEASDRVRKKDERVTRTRRQLDAAFVELLHRRSYGDIRVSDITRKARVGRATFYAHYTSKDELLRSQFNRIVAPMLLIKHDDPALLDASPLLRHIQESPRLFRALVAGRQAGSGPRVLRECFEERVRVALISRDGNSSSNNAPEIAMRSAIVIRAVASSLLAVVACWVESNMTQPASEVQAIFSKLVSGGLTALETAK
jgi:AcrR family transcriptional regulator